MKHLLVFLLSVSACAHLAWSQVVISSSMDSTSDDQVIFPIHLRSEGPAPSAIEFEFAFDSENMTLIGIDKGENLEHADKYVQYHIRQENEKSYLKIVIWGNNQDQISNGPICFLQFHRNHSTRQDENHITSSSASDSNGKSLQTVLTVPDKGGLRVSVSRDSKSPRVKIVSGFRKPVDLYLRRISMINGKKTTRLQLIQADVSGEFVFDRSILNRRSMERLLVLAVKAGGKPDNEIDLVDVEEIQISRSTKLTRVPSSKPAGKY